MSRYGPPANWDRDLKFGIQAELFFENLFEQIAAGHARVEYKHSRYRDGRFYFECQQAPRRGMYEDSGITTSEADYWAYLKPNGAALIAPLELIRSKVRGLPTIRAGEDGDNPLLGKLISANEMFRGDPL